MPAATKKSTLPMGKALLKEGIVTENQLQYALQLRQESNHSKRVGDILVDLGYVTKRQLRDISRKYNYKIPLGQVVVEMGIATEEDIENLIGTQTNTGKPVGQVLLDAGMINQEQLAMAIARQLDYPYIVPNSSLVDRSAIRQFPAQLLKQYGVLPLFKNQDTVTFVLSNPSDDSVIRAISEMTGDNFDLAVATQSSINTTLREVLDETSWMPDTQTNAEENTGSSTFKRYELKVDSRPIGSDSQVMTIVDHILSKAIASRASDIHIDSMYNKLRVRYRIDGQLVYETDLPTHLGDRLVRRIKVLANLSVSDSGELQEGNMYVTRDGAKVDLRVSFFPTVLGPSITIRALTREMGLKDLGDLGMLPKVLTTLKLLLDTPGGFILFTGPTGAGKTTSLYACINYLNSSDVKICTVEAPVEYSIEGIAQSQVRSSTQALMHERIKNMMHQDPDIIVVGEINDEPTAVATAQAALSGHKVFSTIHSDDSFGAMLRMMEMGLRTYLLSSTGMAVITQRLLRRICEQCKEPFTPPRELFKQFKIRDFDPDEYQFYRGKGCSNCNRSGFYGRTGVFELLVLDDEIRNTFLADGNGAALRRIAENTHRYISLREAGFIKALQGETTLDEAMAQLSYSEQQAFSSSGFSKERIEYWMTPGDGSLDRARFKRDTPTAAQAAASEAK